MKNNLHEKTYGYDATFTFLINLYSNQKLPNKFIISGKKGIGKSTFAYHFINYLLSANEENKYNIDNFEINGSNKSFKLVQNNSHPNFFLIDVDPGKDQIGIDKIRKSFDFINRSSFNDFYRIVLINNTEYLNVNAGNALLKILEEPNEKLIIILIHNISFKLLDTIKSRCITFNINFTEEQNISIFEKITNTQFNNFFEDTLISKFLTVGELLDLKNFANEIKFPGKINIENFLNYFFEYNKNKNDKKNSNLLIKLIQIYFYKKNLTNFNENNYILYNSFLKKFSDARKFNLDIGNLYFEFQRWVLHE